LTQHYLRVFCRECGGSCSGLDSGTHHKCAKNPRFSVTDPIAVECARYSQFKRAYPHASDYKVKNGIVLATINRKIIANKNRTLKPDTINNNKSNNNDDNEDISKLIKLLKDKLLRLEPLEALSKVSSLQSELLKEFNSK
jgi:hypothetical protein